MTARRRILAVLTLPVHARNFLASGCLDLLAARGHDVRLVMPAALIERVRRERATALTAIEPIEPCLETAARAKLRRQFRHASLVAREGFRTYRHKVRLRLGARGFAAKVALFRAARRAVDLEGVCRRIEALVPPLGAATALVDRLGPDLVFVPTLIHDGRELEIVKAARRRAIPVAAFAASWDTLTSKGFFLVPPDHLLVWGDEDRHHAAEHHGFPADRVFVTGAPHLDVYGGGAPHEARAAFLGRRGIPADRRVILFAGTTITYWRDEPDQLQALSRAVADGELKDCVIWYRPHPRRRRRDLDEILGLPGIYVDEQALRSAEEGDGYSLRPADLGHYRSLLEVSECVVAAFSTMIVEAALLGRPSLVVAFGLNDRRAGGLIEHWEYEHSARILTTPGVRFCRSLPDLVQGLRDVLGGWDESHRAELRRAAGAIARNADGRGRERIVDTLERLALAPGAV